MIDFDAGLPLAERIRKAEARKQQALEAESERLKEQERYRKAIASAEAELRQLQAEEQKHKWQEAKGEAQRMKAENEAARDRLYGELNTMVNELARRLQPLVAACDQTFVKQAKERIRHIAAAQQQHVQHVAASHPDNPNFVRERALEIEAELRGLAAELPTAYPAWVWLALWLAEAQETGNAELLQNAQGLVIALFGMLPINSPNWQEHLDERLRRQRPEDVCQPLGFD